jgi:hypothetical protein
MMMRHGVMIVTTGRVRTGTRQEVSLHQRNTVKGEIGMIEICVTSSMAEMHTTGSKTGIKSVSVLNRSSTKKGTMTTMVLVTSNLTDSVLLKEGVMQQEESRRSPKT